MKPTYWAMMAMVVYAAYNVVVEKKLAKVSPYLSATFLVAAMLASSLILFPFREKVGVETTNWPTGWQLAIFALFGPLILAADYCYFTAYHKGGTVAEVATVAALCPVIASAIKLGIGGGMPSWSQIVGFLMAIGSVVLVTRGK